MVLARPFPFSFTIILGVPQLVIKITNPMAIIKLTLIFLIRLNFYLFLVGPNLRHWPGPLHFQPHQPLSLSCFPGCSTF